MSVRTVCGTIPAAELGFTQMHEHIFARETPASRLYPALLIDDEEKSLAEVRDYAEAGGRMLIDCSPSDAGRDVSVLRRISEKSGVNIVSVTGFHLPQYYSPGHPVRASDEETLFDIFTDELRNGCREDRSILPGAVKAAVGRDGCVAQTEVCFRAAARAAAAFAVPLIVHTEKGFDALRAAEIAHGNGVPLRRILICHADRQAEDLGIHEEIARCGVMLEYDTVGRFRYHDDESELRLLRHMTELGYAGQILLSLDTTRERMRRYGGSISLTYLRDDFLPLLLRAGFDETFVHRVTVENPARVFES